MILTGKPSAGALALMLGAPAASADAPTYQVEVVEAYATTTTVRGAGEAGYIVGDQITAGQVRAFVATLEDGLILLPLPAGYLSSTALDVNVRGVVVGAVSDSGFPFDTGEPAVWTPDPEGGYSVDIPQQFDTVISPIGPLAVNGGMAVAINNGGTIVGWSRYQGFQGGPTTRFSLAASPVNLAELGFTATVRDLNNSNVAVGGGLRFDLDTNARTALGLPDLIQPGNVGFTDVIAYSVNEAGETVVAANLASVPTENYLTYVHNDAEGYRPLNPAQFPSRFVGFYDNNNRGDVSASGGVYFADEDALFPGYAALLDPADSAWTPALGFIDDQRHVYTTATNSSTGQNAIVVLTPIEPSPCDKDGNGDFDIRDVVLEFQMNGFASAIQLFAACRAPQSE